MQEGRGLQPRPIDSSEGLALPLLEQPQVVEAAIAIDAAFDDELIPEFFFLPLCLALVGAVEVRHLVPDDDRQHMVPDTWTRERALEGGPLFLQVDRLLLPRGESLRAFDPLLQRRGAALGVDDDQLRGLAGQQLPHATDHDITPGAVGLREADGGDGRVEQADHHEEPESRRSLISHDAS